MRVVHFESGLGNQMLDYCDYIAIKKRNPNDRCLAECIVYDIPECNNVISQWNGLEIERIFGIKLDKLSTFFDEDEWSEILEEVRSSEFWNKEWNYPKYVVNALNCHGMNLRSEFTDFEKRAELQRKKKLIQGIIASKTAQSIKRMYRRFKPQIEPLSASFIPKSYDTYEGHTLCYMFKGAGIEKIEKEVRGTFRFPTIKDEKNKSLADVIQGEVSVAVHIRLGDALVYNKKYLDRKYIHKALAFVKQKTNNAHFYIFGNPDGLSWFKDNIRKLPVDVSEVTYVDWNTGENSYIDMQLMSMCKHNIILFSSFAWWAAYLNDNPYKITISPEPKILTTDWI
jgi:hypothetical protein